MSIELNDRDNAIDNILAAMRDAIPPQGMEARIAERLQDHATAPSAAKFRWRKIFVNHAITAAWWRGAITGAATVLLIAGLALLGDHHLWSHSDPTPIATDSTSRKTGTPSYGIPASETHTQPCPHPAVLRTAIVVPDHATTNLGAETYAESAAPSRPAPELPLTDQERGLVRLAKTATPKQIAVLNPEEYANLEAQSALKFEKYFAPPVPTPEAIPEPNPTATQQASPEVAPPAND